MEPVRTFEGKVERRRVMAGSKSEHDAVVLVTPEGTWTLRRQGGNPFQDAILEALEGKVISCRGVVTARTIIMSDWSEIPASR